MFYRKLVVVSSHSGASWSFSWINFATMCCSSCALGGSSNGLPDCPLRPALSHQESSEIAEAADPNPPTPNQIHHTPCWSDTFFLIFVEGGEHWTRVSVSSRPGSRKKMRNCRCKGLATQTKNCLPTCTTLGRLDNSSGNLLFHRFTHSNTLLISKSTLTFRRLTSHQNNPPGQNPLVFYSWAPLLAHQRTQKVLASFFMSNSLKKGKL